MTVRVVVEDSDEPKDGVLDGVDETETAVFVGLTVRVPEGERVGDTAVGVALAAPAVEGERVLDGEKVGVMLTEGERVRVAGDGESDNEGDGEHVFDGVTDGERVRVGETVRVSCALACGAARSASASTTKARIAGGDKGRLLRENEKCRETESRRRRRARRAASASRPDAGLRRSEWGARNGAG